MLPAADLFRAGLAFGMAAGLAICLACILVLGWYLERVIRGMRKVNAHYDHLIAFSDRLRTEINGTQELLKDVQQTLDRLGVPDEASADEAPPVPQRVN